MPNRRPLTNSVGDVRELTAEEAKAAVPFQASGHMVAREHLCEAVGRFCVALRLSAEKRGCIPE